MQQLLKFQEIQYGHMEIARHCYFSQGPCHCHSKYEYMYMLKTINKTKKTNITVELKTGGNDYLKISFK